MRDAQGVRHGVRCHDLIFINGRTNDGQLSTGTDKSIHLDDGIGEEVVHDGILFEGLGDIVHRPRGDVHQFDDGLMEALSAGEAVPDAGLATRLVRGVLLQPRFGIPDVGGHVLEHFTVPHYNDFHLRGTRGHDHFKLQYEVDDGKSHPQEHCENALVA